MDKRRRAILRVSPILFIQLFTQGHEIKTAKCERGLPKDSSFIGMAYNSEFDVFELVFESKTFPETRHGTRLPYVDVQYSVQYETDEVAAKAKPIIRLI